MKNKQFLVAIASAVAITSGAVIFSMGSAEACPFSKSKFSQILDSSPNSGIPYNSAKIAKNLGGIAVLGGLIGGSVYLTRRSRRSNATANITTSASVVNPTYQELEFPASLTQDEKPAKDFARK
ncbi:MAG: hypothetical protein VKL59_09575 [Nostocaceae cyanobacterium]|nr:hypothetical protein [Nostocaceae cyanobacterium]